jgi:UDP-N-acetylglucosamine--N-acetylmuramyl-(pentapeptide) pyrophosphoryl-undecaprenol N-acetylglucosamine transferase
MKIAYGVSSVGLGHARRSLTLAKFLRKSRNDLEITWFCAEPVINFLEKEGEKIPSVCRQLQSLSSVMEDRVSSGKLKDMSVVARTSSSIARQNYSLLKKELSGYDFLVQDEFVETLLAFMWEKHSALPARKAVVTDYLQLGSPGSWNPWSRIVNWYANRILSKAYAICNPRILADEIDSIPESLRNRTMQTFSIVGPILPDPPEESQSALKEKILQDHFGVATDNMKLIVVSVGGTAIGKYLVDFFAKKSEELSRELSSQIIVLLGPRIDPSAFGRIQNDSIRFISFTSNIMGYLKASDCVVCQAGASTLNEILAMGTPCVTVPISNHFEQVANARRFAGRYGFVNLRYEQVSVSSIVASVNEAIHARKHPAVDFSSNVAKAGKLILEAFQI